MNPKKKKTDRGRRPLQEIREIDSWTKERLLASGKYDNENELAILESYANTFLDKEGALLLLDQAVLFLQNEECDFTVRKLVETLRNIVPKGDRSVLEAAVRIIRENAEQQFSDIAKMLNEKQKNGELILTKSHKPARKRSISGVIDETAGLITQENIIQEDKENEEAEDEGSK
jgi:hypothetical protein